MLFLPIYSHIVRNLLTKTVHFIGLPYNQIIPIEVIWLTLFLTRRGYSDQPRPNPKFCPKFFLQLLVLEPKVVEASGSQDNILLGLDGVFLICAMDAELPDQQTLYDFDIDPKRAVAFVE